MQTVRLFSLLAFLLSFFLQTSFGGQAEGKWLFRKNNSDNMDRALNIVGSSFVSLLTTAQGAAYENGWWTENPGHDGKTSVIVRYGDTEPDTIEYKMETPDKGMIWLGGEQTPWGTMERINCDLSMRYRNKSDVPPEGCAWLHIRGWGYSALDGECMYNEDWANLPDSNAPMECLIEAPAQFLP